MTSHWNRNWNWSSVYTLELSCRIWFHFEKLFRHKCDALKWIIFTERPYLSERDRDTDKRERESEWKTRKQDRREKYDSHDKLTGRFKSIWLLCISRVKQPDQQTFSEKKTARRNGRLKIDACFRLTNFPFICKYCSTL